MKKSPLIYTEKISGWLTLTLLVYSSASSTSDSSVSCDISVSSMSLASDLGSTTELTTLAPAMRPYTMISANALPPKRFVP